MTHRTHFFKEEKTQKSNFSCWGRRTNRIHLTDSSSPLAESCAVGRHTEHLHLPGRVLQSVSGPPVPGICEGQDMIKKLLLRLRRLLEPWPWIWRDENDNMTIIDLSNREESVRIIIDRIYYSYWSYYFFPTYSSFSENHNASSKILEFIKYFEIDKDELIRSQSAFAVIEFKIGPPILIGLFKPVNISKTKCPDIIHTEEQCIYDLNKTIQGKEHAIKNIYIFTKYSPCLGRKGHDPCMIQLARFSEEMFYHKINAYITFQDIYGATGNNTKAVDELKNLCHKQDDLFQHRLSRLKRTAEKHYRSKFKYFKEGKKQDATLKNNSIIKNYITTEITKIADEKSRKFISSIYKFKIKFPNDEMTLDEFKTFGKEQADEMKMELRDLNVNEEISERVRCLFNSKWCDLANERYEEFLYEELIERINTLALRFALQDIKAITKCFNLIRVDLSLHLE